MVTKRSVRVSVLTIFLRRGVGLGAVGGFMTAASMVVSTRLAYQVRSSGVEGLWAGGRDAAVAAGAAWL